jgi:hypothetical protein
MQSPWHTCVPGHAGGVGVHVPVSPGVHCQAGFWQAPQWQELLQTLVPAQPVEVSEQFSVVLRTHWKVSSGAPLQSSSSPLQTSGPR